MFANSSAISPEAIGLRRASSEIVGWQLKSEVLSGQVNKLNSKLNLITSSQNLLEFELSAPSPSAVINARAFIAGLQPLAVFPDLLLEDDGSITFDWFFSRNKMLSVTVGSNNRLPFAWHLGADQEFGVAVFDGVSTPKQIAEALKSLSS